MTKKLWTSKIGTVGNLKVVFEDCENERDYRFTVKLKTNSKWDKILEYKFPIEYYKKVSEECDLYDRAMIGALFADFILIKNANHVYKNTDFRDLFFVTARVVFDWANGLFQEQGKTFPYLR